jgi:glucose/arabinose dehydrogenase
MRQRSAPGLLALTCAALAASVPAQTVPTGFVVDTLVSTGLTAPNDFCFLPDGRILIANRPGGVTVYANGPTASVGTVPNVEVGSERGLLGICADPNFATNGYVYVWYSHTGTAFMHLDRFTCTGDLNNPASTVLSFVAGSQRSILNNAPDNAFNHNGGTPRFGPDGKLYLCIGDDASSCEAQNVNTLQGVLLRMNVSGLPAGGSATPPTAAQLDPGDNPLSANTNHSKLVIAYGLRNPYKLDIDPLTNNVYIGDVGQNAWEEYDEYIYQAGNLQLVNFGWPWREANASWGTCGGGQPPGLVAPIAAVSAGSGWRSVMGGPRYRNTGGAFDFGPSYEGNAFYGDYFSGTVRRLVNSGGIWSAAPAVPGQPNANDWMANAVAHTSIQVGPDGGLYMVGHPSTYATSGGSLKRIKPVGPQNQVLAISGGGQVGPSQEVFPLPIVVQVLNPAGNPLPGGQVNFSVSGPAGLSTTNPVTADASGFAQTYCYALNAGGPIAVSATAVGGSPIGVSFNLFARDIAVIGTTTVVAIQITHSSTALPPNVPWLILMSLPGMPPVPTPIGPICTNPAFPGTLVIEDSIGWFGFNSMSGTWAVGNPGVTKIYNVPNGILNGLTLMFQAIGDDPVAGLVRTDCHFRTF